MPTNAGRIRRGSVAPTRIQYLWIFVAGGLSIPQPSAADSVAIAPLKDNTLYESSLGASSNGRGQNFFSGATATGARRRGIISFDIVANVPAGSTINSASLTLHMSKTISGSIMISLHRCLAPWGEGNSIATDNEGRGAAAAPNDATWLHALYDTAFWSNPGGDFSSASSTGVLVGATNFYTWPSTAQVVAEVQSWLDSPQTNFGWVLVADSESPRSAKRFDTRENVNPDFRPVLQVQFTPPADGGFHDGGLEDGGPNDGGSPDAGFVDAGPDAGAVDGGADGGMPDSGLPDGGQSLLPASQSGGCGYQTAPTGLSLLMGVLAVLLLATVRHRTAWAKRARGANWNSARKPGRLPP